jgi:sterol desaturase/sphingolipid hydroxylase (fatty acid hydroxylase superfamily)
MNTSPIQELAYVKAAATVLLLVLFWSWETWFPFSERRQGRWEHAGRNLAVALCNAFLLAIVFGTATVFVADWTGRNKIGLLSVLDAGWLVRLGLTLLLLDVWMYVWHRANHSIPFLWRFHRMHHADDHMDVTTATRFHPGEHAVSATLRLALIPLAGFELWHVLLYDALVVAVTMFHHANISLGWADRPIRWLLVTPDLHKVHHSREMPETNSNYATVLSMWDRLAGTLRTRTDPHTIALGLDEFDDPYWQTFAGMLQTPFTGGRTSSGHVVPFPTRCSERPVSQRFSSRITS